MYCSNYSLYVKKLKWSNIWQAHNQCDLVSFGSANSCYLKIRDFPDWYSSERLDSGFGSSGKRPTRHDKLTRLQCCLICSIGFGLKLGLER